MKFLLVLGLCAIAIASRRDWQEVRREEIREDSYRTERVYNYLYKGQIATGLPKESNQHAATRVEAQVKLVFPNNERTAVLKLDNIRFGSLNREIPEPRELQRFEMFQEKEIEEERLRLLRLPVRFQYVNGLVSEIEFDREDKPWSENMKRAVLNLVQVNLKKNARTDFHEDRSIRRETSRIEQTEEMDSFTAQEKTLEGDCEVYYTLNELPVEEREREENIKVTKSINFEKCHKKIEVRYNHRFAEKCLKCHEDDETERMTKRSTVYNYNIIGNKDRFLIKDAEVKSFYVLTPLGEEDATMKTVVVGRLELIKVEEKRERMEEPHSERKETIMYSLERLIKIERFYMNGDEELTEDHPYRQYHHKYELVEQTIRKMVVALNSKENGIESEAAHQLHRLVEILRMCSEQELEKICREMCYGNKFEEKVQKKVRDIMIDALALAGTKNTIELLVKRIEKGEISVLKSAKAIQSLMNVQVVSEKHIDMILRLSKREICERNPILKQACRLTVGSMINALCRDSKDRLAIEMEEDRICPRQVKERYVRELMDLYRQANTRYEKVLALKTLANAGIDLSVYELEKMIVEKKEEKVIRVQAIDALRQLRTVMPRKIQRVLMPVFKDRTEHPEIRINALVQIMHTMPERAVLDQIAESLHHEQSRQVQAFTRSIMHNFANSKIPCERKLGEDLKLALSNLRVDTSRWTDSKYVHIPLYNAERDMGMTLDLASIFTKDSVLPRELMMNLDTLMAKQWMKSNVQIGVTQNNLEQLIEKLLGETEDKTREDIAVRGRRDAVKPADLLRSLYEKLAIRGRRERSPSFAMAYLRIRNLDYVVVPMDAETLPETMRMLHGGRMDMNRVEEYLTRGCHFYDHFAMNMNEMTRFIPTTLGMPLMIKDTMPTIVGLEGEFKALLSPKRSNRFDGTKIVLKMKTSVATSHVLVVRTWSPLTSSGLKLRHNMELNLPIDAELEMTYGRKMNLKLKVKVPEERQQLLAARTRAVTCTSSWPIDPIKYVEPHQKTVQMENRVERMRAFDWTFGEKYMGMRFNIRGQTQKNWLRLLQQTPMLWTATENAVEVTMEKSRGAPREFVTEMDFEIRKEERMERPEMDRFYSERTESKLFDMDREEEEFETEEREHRQVRRVEQHRDEEERLRQQEFNRYVRQYNPQRGYKLHMNVRVNAIGAPVERKAEVEIQTGCDERLRYFVFVANGRRVPLFEDEKRDWTFKTKIQALYPEAVRSVQELLEKKHRELNSQIELEWGANKRQFIHMKIQGEQDREQREMLNRIDNERSPVERHQQVLAATQLNQYKIVATYDMCPQMTNYFSQLCTMLGSAQPWNHRVTPAQNPEKRVVVKLTIDPHTNEYVTLLVETPRQTVHIQDIRLPFKVAPLMQNMHRTSYPVQSVRQFVRKTLQIERAECTVSTRQVNTFDDAEIRLPLTTCYSVLAKDCRSEEPKFAVLMKKIAKNTEEKKMKIIDEERVIELQRIGEEIEVRINGHVEDDQQKLERVGINRKDEMVICELEDLTVRFDGKIASIRMSPLFKNGQCGICGHYDGERDDELRTADNELTHDLEKYHRSYLTRDQDCDIDEEVLSKKTNYRMHHDESARFEEEDEEQDVEIEKPVLRTHVIEYNHEMCFSTKAVPECPKGTFAKESRKTEMKVSFACIPRSRHETSQLARRARTEVINMHDYKPSFVETIMVPRDCLVF